MIYLKGWNKIKLINQLGQYHRSLHMVELTGIPSKNNKNVMDYVAHSVELADNSNYHSTGF